MKPSNGPCGCPRVLLFPLPYQGHINPMLRLAAALHARGFAITVVHTETRAPDRRKLPVEYELVTIRDGVPPELAESDDVVPFVLALNRSCAAPFREYLAGARVACVVADVDWFAPLAAARDLGVKALPLMTSSAAKFRVYLAFPILEEKGYLPIRESNLDTEVKELPPLLVRDLHHEKDTTRYHAYADLLSHMVAGVRQSSGLILNTLDAIEGTDIANIYRDISLPVFAIGPLHILSPSVDSSLLLQDRSCLEWLDAQPPGSVIYASLGSLMSIDVHELTEMAWGLAGSKHPFLWVVRQGLVHGCEFSEVSNELQEEIRDRGRIVSWAPQQEVLKHPAMGAFLTHCGWNSTLESILEGVPMICRPLGGDQLCNARYVCEVWKVGIRVVEVENQLTRGDVQVAIERLMGQNEGEEVRERMIDLRDAAAKCTSKGESTDVSLQRLVDFIVST
ncbi:DIMBOA UDP-glucosyltransferase BX8 [Dichanthelium oligosanthes]|uniref:Glycosyltransferase n=1 Tax=Dichanthelium oligosanthes TaxID=888268 RepID=A0A1E5UWR9_9POAL|nr:DIMBOA UDP-glucosyltransferase BX8 [Dichanthelium oligosanthes]